MLFAPAEREQSTVVVGHATRDRHTERITRASHVLVLPEVTNAARFRSDAELLERDGDSGGSGHPSNHCNEVSAFVDRARRCPHNVVPAEPDGDNRSVA